MRSPEHNGSFVARRASSDSAAVRAQSSGPSESSKRSSSGRIEFPVIDLDFAPVTRPGLAPFRATRFQTRHGPAGHFAGAAILGVPVSPVLKTSEGSHGVTMVVW